MKTKNKSATPCGEIRPAVGWRTRHPRNRAPGDIRSFAPQRLAGKNSAKETLCPLGRKYGGHHKDHRRGGGTRPRQPLFADRPPTATSNLADFDPVSIGTRDPEARKGEAGRKEKTRT